MASTMSLDSMSTSVERDPEDMHNRDTDPWSVPSSITDNPYAPDMQDQVPILADDDNYQNPTMNRYDQANSQICMHRLV